MDDDEYMWQMYSTCVCYSYLMVLILSAQRTHIALITNKRNQQTPTVQHFNDIKHVIYS